MIKSILILLSAFIMFIAGAFHTEDKIIIKHNFPDAVKAGDEFTVVLTVQNMGLVGSARLQQNLPQGFVAEEIESNGADFIFEQQNVKFIWPKFPAEKEFSVSYKIKTDKNITGNYIIKGLFVYIENDKTLRQNLDPIDIRIADNMIAGTVNPEVTRSILCLAPENGEYRVDLSIRPNKINQSAKFTDEIPENFSAELVEAHDASFTFENHSAIFNWTKLPADSVFTVSYIIKSGKAGASPVINGIFTYNNNPAEEPVNDNVASIKDEPAPLVADAKPVIPEKKLIPVPEKGVIFKVQVSATQKSSVKNSEWFSSKYNINSNVELSYHEGWKKYTIGSFQAYQEANNFRKHTQEKIPDAFVVAYENGMRIPLSEARRNKTLNQ